jgi:hypothetical protein
LEIIDHHSGHPAGFAPHALYRVIDAWRQEYNVSLPHRALPDRTPAEFASQIAASRDLTETSGRTIPVPDLWLFFGHPPMIEPRRERVPAKKSFLRWQGVGVASKIAI